MRVWYDYVAGRAKVAVTEGLLAGKIFLRIYASKKEYMIRGGDYASCRRSYLGESQVSSGVFTRSDPGSIRQYFPWAYFEIEH